MNEGVAFLLDARRAMVTLEAALELGVFDALAEAPLSADALAERCSVRADRMRRLLTALDAMQTVERRDELWESRIASAEIAMLLMPQPLVGPLRGEAPAHRADRPDGAAALYRRGARGLARIMAPAARALADRIAPGHPDVLELGAGAAPWGRALMERDPAVRVTAVDLPPVVDAMRPLLDAEGVRLEWLAGDLFEMALPEGRFDRVLVPNLLHLFAPDRNVELLRVAARAARPGGEVVVIDVIRDVDARDRSLALYDLTLATRTVDGRVYAEAEIRAWARDVDLAPRPAEPLGDTKMDALRATRRPHGSDAAR